MFKKMKGISSYSKPFYGVGLYQNANSSFKHQALMQDYKELQKEAHVIRNKLDAAKQRKLMLAAEVRFLRRRYKWLLKTKSLNSSQEQHIEQPLNSVNQTKNKEEHFFSRMGTTLHKLPSIPDAKSNRKLTIGKQTSRCSASLFHNLKHEQVLHGGEEAIHPISTHVSDRNNRGGIKCGKETLMQCAIPSFDLNQKERMCRANDVGLRNSTVAFDLNQDSDLSRKEACMPSQTPLFDLNEISTEDEDFQSNFEPSKFEEAKMGLIRAVNGDQNDLKLSLCRNAEEGSSSVGEEENFMAGQCCIELFESFICEVSEDDSNFVDSENDLEDKDDTLYEQNVTDGIEMGLDGHAQVQDEREEGNDVEVDDLK